MPLPVCAAAVHCRTEPEAHRSAHMWGLEEEQGKEQSYFHDPYNIGDEEK